MFGVGDAGGLDGKVDEETAYFATSGKKKRKIPASLELFPQAAEKNHDSAYTRYICVGRAERVTTKEKKKRW
jgi:hypothetical protein